MHACYGYGLWVGGARMVLYQVGVCARQLSQLAALASIGQKLAECTPPHLHPIMVLTLIAETCPIGEMINAA
jgi:hypothetical protein